MKRLHGRGWACLLAAAVATAGTADAAPGPTAEALLAIWEHAADATLETASPQRVIYQDGTVIEFQTDTSRGVPQARFVTGTLGLAEVNIWYDDIHTIARDEELKGRYRIGGRDAERAVTFYFQAGAHGLLITIDGLSERALSPFGALLHPPTEEVPVRLLRIYQDLRRLKFANAQPWQPEWIEARFRPLDGAHLARWEWPRGWPAPALSPDGRPTEAALAVPAADFLRVRQLSRESAEWQPVALDGGGIRVAFRPVLPGEGPWRRHIAADLDVVQAARTALARAQLSAEREQVRAAFQERVGAPAGPAAAVSPVLEPAVLSSPPIDRAAPKLSPLPPTPDPPMPKSRRTR